MQEKQRGRGAGRSTTRGVVTAPSFCSLLLAGRELISFPAAGPVPRRGFRMGITLVAPQMRAPLPSLLLPAGARSGDVPGSEKGEGRRGGHVQSDGVCLPHKAPRATSSWKWLNSCLPALSTERGPPLARLLLHPGHCFHLAPYFLDSTFPILSPCRWGRWELSCPGGKHSRAAPRCVRDAGSHEAVFFLSISHSERLLTAPPRGSQNSQPFFMPLVGPTLPRGRGS